ncbi:MAG: SagB/ThcOx family dehydrogenase [Candidatus Hodarchaeales archaeon]
MPSIMKTAFPTVTQLKLVVAAVVLVFSILAIIIEFIPFESDNLALPEPDLIGHLPLSTAIHQSKVTTNLYPHDLSVKELSQLLWALQGTTHGPGFRTVPSAGATYPLKIFIQQNGNSHFSSGYYSYNSDEHVLKLHSSINNESQLVPALLSEDQNSVSNITTIFYIFADFNRTTDRYGTRGIQYVHLEVGHALQNFLLQLSSLNLNTWIISDFNASRVKELLHISLQPLMILPVGQDQSNLKRFSKLDVLSVINTEEMTVEQAIAKRKSTRDYVSGLIPLSIISDILNDSMDVNFPTENISIIDLRLVVGEVKGLSMGIYSYSLTNHSLIHFYEGDARNSLRKVALDQSWVESAQLNVIISANMTWMDQQSNPDLSYRRLMSIIGIIAQNIYLKCAAHSLGTVVIGAFSEGGVAQLLEIPDSHSPFYILPIGLIPAFFDQETGLFVPLSEIGHYIGLFSFILFYTSFYLTLPVLKRRLRQQVLWFHYFSGSLLAISIVFHYMVLHGHVKSLSEFSDVTSYLSAILDFPSVFSTFPTTRYDVGQLLATLGFISGIIFTVSGLLLVLEVRSYRKILRTIHKYSVFITLIFIIFHNLLNGTFLVIKPRMFLYLNILVFSLYYFIHNSFEQQRQYRKHLGSVY